MTNKELFHFACQCLSLDDHPEFANGIISILANDENCKSVVQFCSKYWILPVVYVKFRSHNLLPSLPEEFADFLAEVHQLNRTRNEQILKQLQQITNILGEREIHPTLLKGAGNLVDNLYSDVGERMMSDIDFLVSEEDYLLSAELMEKAGYRKLVKVSGYEDVMSMKHYPKLYHPDYPGAVEIHRIPVDKEYLTWFNQDLINSERRLAFSTEGYYILSDNHKIIQNFIHSQLTNEGYLFGRINLRDIYDLYLFSKRIPLEQTLPQIKEHRKASAYFALTLNVIGLQETFEEKKNLEYKILKIKHDLRLSSPFLYEVFRSSVFISQRVFLGYIGQFLKIFYSKEMRKSVLKRLTTRKWYKDHLGLYKRFFVKKK